MLPSPPFPFPPLLARNVCTGQVLRPLQGWEEGVESREGVGRRSLLWLLLLLLSIALPCSRAFWFNPPVRGPVGVRYGIQRSSPLLAAPSDPHPFRVELAPENTEEEASAGSLEGRRDRKRPGPGGKGGKRVWERSAPEEFLLILSELRAQYGGLEAVALEGRGGEAFEEADADGSVEKDIAEVIKLVRALANRSWEQATESAALLCRSPLMDLVLARMLISAATRGGEPDLALQVLGGMYERRVFPDVFVANMVVRAAVADPRWTPVVDVVRAQLSSNPSGGGGSGRRHQGFTQALASAVERGKFYSSSHLVSSRPRGLGVVPDLLVHSTRCEA